MTLRIYVDTNVFIEARERSSGVAASAPQGVLSAVDGGCFSAVLGELVVAELLVKPFRLDDESLIEAYLALLTPQIGYRLCPVDRDVLVEAARLRAINPSTKLPDAIHVATARLQECRAFLTAETRLSMPDGLVRLSLNASTMSERQSLS